MSTDDKQNTKEYLSSLKPIWCPGCGDYGVLNAMASALAELSWPHEQIAAISGIGCSSRLPGYLSTYGFNSIHGRALPIACGLKIARPELKVIAMGGDGDGFSIGGGHVPHVVRRNVDLTYLVMDNSIYGLTKGQVSPTTPCGETTATTAYGSIDIPIQPLEVMLGYGTTFIAQSSPLYLKHLTDIIVKALQHPGFSYVNILSPCVTYRGKETYQNIKDHIFYVEDVPGYDPHDRQKAWGLITDPKKYPMGIIYQGSGEPYNQKLEKLCKIAKEKEPKATLETEKKSFLPS
jgi:2-oxoglutarate ferredoxin oxidoreductase subunit beta